MWYCISLSLIDLYGLHILKHAHSLTEMPFNLTIGSIFNCGFCRTVVYEYLAEKREDMQKSKDSQSKPSESKESASVDSQLHCNTSVNEVDGEKSANGKVCVSDHFRPLQDFAL